MFFIICAMDNPSGSAPFTIASTISGARLFKPSTRVTYGGFKPGFAARSVIFAEIPFLFLHKSRKFTSFFGAFCICFGEKVLSVEQKNFLCCIKKQKQRYFRELTKRWPFFINLQPFEPGRKFQIKRKWSTIFLFSTIQSFMTGFFYILLLPNDWQALIA